MKRTLLIFLLFIGLLITSSGFNQEGKNIAVGSLLPDIADNEISDLIRTYEKEGEYVLINFWSSTDGNSRLSTNTYTSWLKRNDNSKINMISINFDKSDKLFRQIVKFDDMNTGLQFNVSGHKADKIQSDFNLKNGYGSILVDPEGRIVSHNPTIDYLNHISG